MFGLDLFAVVMLLPDSEQFGWFQFDFEHSFPPISIPNKFNIADDGMWMQYRLWGILVDWLEF